MNGNGKGIQASLKLFRCHMRQSGCTQRASHGSAGSRGKLREGRGQSQKLRSLTPPDVEETAIGQSQAIAQSRDRAIRQSGNPAIRQSDNPAIRQSPKASIRQSANRPMIPAIDCRIWQSNPAMPSIGQSGNCWLGACPIGDSCFCYNPPSPGSPLSPQFRSCS